MAQTSVQKLDDHDAFPSIAFPLVGGGSMNLPDDLKGKWSVVLVYRGYF
jgi:hypothetical protein